MLAQSIFEYSGGKLSISLDNWGNGEWMLAALCVNFVYGLVTHLHSAQQVRKWNRSGGLGITVVGSVMMLFFRLFLQLSWRILCLPCGLIGFVASFQNNDALKAAWKWHKSPIDIWDDLPNGVAG